MCSEKLSLLATVINLTEGWPRNIDRQQGQNIFIPPTKWVPGHLPGGKETGAQRWPPTPI